MIAHSLPAWRSPMKDIAKVLPFAGMMARETGTMLFHGFA
jgi:hypothetical protein